MTDPNDPAPAPDDSWMTDIPTRLVGKALPAKGARKAPSRPVAAPANAPAAPAPRGTTRPLADLAADLEAAPLVAGPAPVAAGHRQRDTRPHGQIWKGCPVTPLGYLDSTFFYLDPLGQLRALTKHDAQSIMALFNRALPKLYDAFPKYTGSDDKVVRKREHFDHQLAASAMLKACGEKGLFNPEGSIRGVGAWADDDGQLVYHLGDALLVAGEERPPQSHQRRIYPAAPPIPHPAQAGKTDAAQQLHEVLSTWSWTRPDIDPEIAAGMIGVMILGGALAWRPAFWVTGGPGTGKSALQRLLLHIMGGEAGLIQSPDATARGIASALGYSSLPVAMDELEPGEEGSTKGRAIIELARVAASGGRWMRGSSDQKGASGQLQSTFVFSSILIPGVLKSQDLQRIIVLALNPIPEGAIAPSLRADTWRGRGAALKRDLIDRWPSWPARLEAWREAFATRGITGRAADNWASTLAMAQMMRAADMPQPDELAGWVAKVSAHVTADLAEVGSDADEVLMHLLTKVFDPFRRGEQYTIAQWLQVAAGYDHAPAGLCEGAQDRRAAANAHLARLLVKVVPDEGGPRLFVGNAKAAGLLELFAGTQWAGGAWKQSLERVKGATLPKGSRTLAGIATRGVEIPLTSIPSLANWPQDRIVTARAVTPNLTPAEMEDF